MHTSDGTDLALRDLAGSGDDRLLGQGAGLCAQMLPSMAMSSRQTTAQQTSGSLSRL